MDVPALPTSLPLWAQIVIYGALFLGVGAVYAWRYRSEMKKAEPDHGKQVVLQAASFADLSLFRTAADDVSAIRKNTSETTAEIKAIRTMMEEDAAEKEDDERIQIIVDKLLQDKIKARSPQRRRRKSPPAAE